MFTHAATGSDVIIHHLSKARSQVSNHTDVKSGFRGIFTLHHLSFSLSLSLSLSLSCTLESIQASKGLCAASLLSSFKTSLLCGSKSSHPIHTTFCASLVLTTPLISLSLYIDSDIDSCVWLGSARACEEAPSRCEVALLSHPPSQRRPPPGRLLWQEALLVRSRAVSKAV